MGDEGASWGVIWTFVAIASGGLMAYAIQMRAETNYTSAWAFLMLSALPLGICTVAWTLKTSPPENLRRVISSVVGCYLGGVALLGVTELLSKSASAQQTTIGTSNVMAELEQSSLSPKAIPVQANSAGNQLGNFSIGQQGGVNNQTYVNQTAQPFQFTPELGVELQNVLPKDKLIHVFLIGPEPSSIPIGQQVHGYLAQHGFQVDFKSAVNYVPRQSKPLVWDEPRSTLWVTPTASDR